MWSFAFSIGIVILMDYSDNLPKSTIILIPRDAKTSQSNVDNYREISLSNSINKVFDYVIIELY